MSGNNRGGRILLITKGLLLAASIALAAPGNAQDAPASPDAAAAATAIDSAKAARVVEGDTPARVAQVERCQSHKFESLVEIDAVKKRTTRVKLCANRGSSDADWVKTLEAAVAQIEQRNMPPEAREKLIGQLRSEIARFAPPPKSAAITQGANLFGSGEAGAASSLIAPSERYETSILPQLPSRKVASANAAVVSTPQRPMRIRLKCLERGQVGAGGTCDFFVADTILVISAVEGLEEGGTLRFLRRGDPRGEVRLAPMQAGQSIRVRLPAELCHRVANSKVEIELLGPKSAGAVAARLGPFGLRC